MLQLQRLEEEHFFCESEEGGFDTSMVDMINKMGLIETRRARAQLLCILLLLHQLFMLAYSADHKPRSQLSINVSLFPFLFCSVY